MTNPDIRPAPGSTVQVLFRLRPELLAQIDERKSAVGLSRNAWLVKAVEWALKQPIKETTVTKVEKV